jgi:colanic acid biosynthesis protein WcaH
LTDLREHFNAISLAVGDARKGLTKPVFLFISKLTPMVNVDLLIRNEVGQTLLSWRHDEFYGPGWHIPGGVIRFKESAATRIAKVAETEFGITVMAEKTPVCIHEVMAPNRDIRGHFISILYACKPTTQPSLVKKVNDLHPLKNGQWKWHDNCPDDIIHQHEIYREHING